MSLLHFLIAESIGTQAMIQMKNQEKIDEALDKYWDACKYPRKIKKQMRKEAQKDYNFWVSLQNTHNSMFSLN